MAIPTAEAITNQNRNSLRLFALVPVAGMMSWSTVGPVGCIVIGHSFPWRIHGARHGFYSIAPSKWNNCWSGIGKTRWQMTALLEYYWNMKHGQNLFRIKSFASCRNRQTHFFYFQHLSAQSENGHSPNKPTNLNYSRSCSNYLCLLEEPPQKKKFLIKSPRSVFPIGKLT